MAVVNTLCLYDGTVFMCHSTTKCLCSWEITMNTKFYDFPSNLYHPETNINYLPLHQGGIG